MDWSKAKSIMIIALLITNTILFGFNIYNYKTTSDSSNTRGFIEETASLLDKKRIKIKTSIPRSEIKLHTLRVEFESFDPGQLNERFFNSSGNVDAPSTGLTKINYKKELISIINNRRMIYENSSNVKNFEVKSFSDAQDIANDFLINHKFETRDMKLSHMEKIGNSYVLNYSKTYDDIIVEKSYTNFVIDSSGVVSMDRLWLNVTDISESQIHLIPASKALLTLLDDNEYYNRTITNIDACYYFDPEEQGYVEDITKAEQGRAIPAWRIQFDDGENIEIDNF